MPATTLPTPTPPGGEGWVVMSGEEALGDIGTTAATLPGGEGQIER